MHISSHRLNSYTRSNITLEYAKGLTVTHKSFIQITWLLIFFRVFVILATCISVGETVLLRGDNPSVSSSEEIRRGPFHPGDK